MKQFFSSIFLLLFTAAVWAQAPQAINYQGVARNASGVAYAGQQINVRLSIHTGTPEGTIEYSETRSVTTNQFGLFNVQIGSAGASAIQGNFAAINWAVGVKFLQTEISVNGQPYANLGTTQMMSVPFAINSKMSSQLVLPFDTSINSNNGHVFRIKNTSIASYNAISGESINGYGISGSSENNTGIFGFTKGKKQNAIRATAFADSAVGVLGYVHFSNKDGVGVFGDGSTNNNGVRGKSVNKAGVQGFSENNYGVYGQSKDFDAVAGSSLNMTGVSGSSVNGVGVIGLSENGPGGVYGSAGYAGTAKYGVMGEAWGYSTGVSAKNNTPTSYALHVEGRIKINGMGQSPGVGKVLTSDAQGNATWENPYTVAFRASSLRNDQPQTIASNTTKKVLFFQQARYNIGNAYDAENSIFFPPVAGIYHLYAQVDWASASPFAIFSIQLLRNGTISTIAESRSGSLTSTNVVHSPTITTEIALQPNDAVWIEIYQSNESSSSKTLVALGYQSWFTGRLITRL